MTKCPNCSGIIEEKETWYQNCVNLCNCNPASHGNITITQTCKDCGIYQKININNKHVEKGMWRTEIDVLYVDINIEFLGDGINETNNRKK